MNTTAESSSGQSSSVLVLRKITQPPLCDRYALQDTAQVLLPKSRVNTCRKRFVMGSMQAHLMRAPDGRHHYGGLETCGSVWVCPVCAAKIAMHRRDELAGAIAVAKGKGYKLRLLTLTAPHQRDDELKDLLEKLHVARRLFRNRKVWKRLAAKWGLVGSVVDQEVTYGGNGWHVHFHEILISSEVINKSDQAELLEAWQSACVKVGLDCPNEHGLDLRDGSEADRYIAKFGLALELTLTHSKTARHESSSTPWGLLMKAANGDTVAGWLFTVYAAAFTGRKQLVWSKGLKDILCPEQTNLSDDEIAAQEVIGSEVVLSISPEDWRLIVRARQRGVLLRLVDEQGIDAYNGFMLSLYRRFLYRDN